ncbi:MAG: peptidoglycan recognition protein family protein [Nanoarchaeota archaeon]|nr:peptidoglycan recognition protein family protein [Nanoarchaeota archaeon]
MKFLKKIKFLVVHHSQKEDDSLERIKNFHVNERKWEDIGYHYIIDKKGKLHKAREEKFIGAHVFGFNRESLGICLLGNLDKEIPTKNQIKTLVKLLIKKAKENKISSKNILGHREFPGVTKTCPGKLVNMNEIRKKVKEHFSTKS